MRKPPFATIYGKAEGLLRSPPKRWMPDAHRHGILAAIVGDGESFS